MLICTSSKFIAEKFVKIIKIEFYNKCFNVSNNEFFWVLLWNFGKLSATIVIRQFWSLEREREKCYVFDALVTKETSFCNRCRCDHFHKCTHSEPGKRPVRFLFDFSSETIFLFFNFISSTRLTRIQKNLWRRGWRHLYIFEYINLLQLMFKSYIKIQSVIKIEFIFVSLSGDNFCRLILFI